MAHFPVFFFVFIFFLFLSISFRLCRWCSLHYLCSVLIRLFMQWHPDLYLLSCWKRPSWHQMIRLATEGTYRRYIFICSGSPGGFFSWRVSFTCEDPVGGPNAKSNRVTIQSSSGSRTRQSNMGGQGKADRCGGKDECGRAEWSGSCGQYGRKPTDHFTHGDKRTHRHTDAVIKWKMHGYPNMETNRAGRERGGKREGKAR